MKRILPSALPDRLFLYGGAGAVLGLFGPWHWVPDMFSHFLPQQMALLAVFAGIKAFKREWKPMAAGLIFLGAIGLPQLLPYLVPRQELVRSSDSHIVVLYTNVHTANREHGKVLAMVRGQRPDVLVVSEVNDAWDRVLSDGLREYPYFQKNIRRDNFGLSVYSKVPLYDARTLYLGSAQVPTIRAVLKLRGKDVVLWATHPVPPVGREYWEMRNEQILTLRALFDSEPGTRIVAGDLNAAPWCAWFRVIKGEDLKDSAEGFGLQMSWPSFYPAVLRVMIDHILVTRDIRVEERKVLGAIGSDHFPVLVRLGVPAG